jgi:hypothetical protein
MATEPGQLVLTILNKLVDRIKSTQPIRTDGKSVLSTGFVYSQLVLGMPVDPRDFMNPWSPTGGATLQTSQGGVQQAAAAAAAPTPDPRFRRALQAAFNTSQLVDKMILVTNDDTLLEYPTTRHVSFAYEGIINGMQPLPPPPIPDDIQKQINDAQKVIHKLDDEGNIIGKTPLYANYLKNSKAYADAKKAFADAQAAALNDPLKAETWPMDSVVFQEAVDQAWDSLKTEGAEKVERALDIINSVGISLQAHMVANAREVYKNWNLGLAGVPVPIPYSYIMPTGWCDPDNDDEGWTRLQVSQSDFNSHQENHYRGHTEDHISSSSSSGSAGVGVFLGFVNLAAEGSSSSSDFSAHSNWKFSSENSFHNDATGLSIDLEYALCTIERPWLIGDLFYMPNWYLVGNAKKSVSDGTVQGQVVNPNPLLPMIPVQMLVIRNVSITATHWGNDGNSITSAFGSDNYDSSTSSESGGGAVSFGFITFGGSGSHSSSHTDTSSDAGGDSSSNYRVTWDGQTLSIHGAQVIAFLSQITPACAPLDDPHLTH